MAKKYFKIQTRFILKVFFYCKLCCHNLSSNSMNYNKDGAYFAIENEFKNASNTRFIISG